MRHLRRRGGVTIIVASDDPQRGDRTVRLSAGRLSALRLGTVLLALLAAMVASLLLLHGHQLDRLQSTVTYLERTLSARERDLAMHRSQLNDANYATSRLLAELSSVGALVREVQSVAGLDPVATEVASVAPAATSFASGGVDGIGLPPSSVDTVFLDFDALVSEAVADLSLLTDSLDAVRDAVEDRHAETEAVPRLWPVGGWISSQFGWRVSPISGRTLMHKGIDVVAPHGTPVAATAPGTAVTAGWSDRGYGYRVVIDHGYGYRTLYAHLNEVSVDVGQHIDLGDSVGSLGSTGYSTGPHLHYEVWHNGVAIDPRDFLPE